VVALRLELSYFRIRFGEPTPDHSPFGIGQ
jgi:hypothetical protein